MIYDILFAIAGIGLIALGFSLFKLDTKVDSWLTEVLRLMKLMNDWDDHRFTDNARVGEAFKRIQALEDRLEGQEALAAGLEEKIKALEETVEYLENKL